MKRLFLLISLCVATIALAQTIYVYQDCDKNVQPATSGVLDGHEWVDLGLPSGTLWATCNVGASTPEENGKYFAWGETSPKSKYSWSTYKYGTAENQLTKYCTQSNYGKNGFTDNKTVLDAEDDAATANWGNGWRMPTKGELDELCNNCSSVWTTQGGKKGRLLAGPNGNTLFLPAAGYYLEGSLYDAGSEGYYWSNSLGGNPDRAYYLVFDWDDSYTNVIAYNHFNAGRFNGQSVRPVVRR